MRIPWEGKNNPHGTLDLLRRCNISCRGCYNNSDSPIKTFEEVKADFAALTSLRNIDTVSLTGGDVTLHPRLFDIVSHIKSKGVKVAILTNGVLLDSTMIVELKRAGVYMVMVHIQMDQKRPDLPETATLEDVEELRDSKLQMIAEHDVVAGVAYTIYKDRSDELRRLLDISLKTKHVSCLLLTVHSGFEEFAQLKGNLEEGYRLANDLSVEQCVRKRDYADVAEILDVFTRSGFRPFSYVGANDDPRNRCWHIYLHGTAFRMDGSVQAYSMRSSLLERAFVWAVSRLRGRTPFLYKPDPWRFRGQLLLNALLGGDVLGNLSFLWKSLKSGVILQNKHFILQLPPELMLDGRVRFCRGCPDATIRKGKLHPSCLVDRIMAD